MAVLETHRRFNAASDNTLVPVETCGFAIGTFVQSLVLVLHCDPSLITVEIMTGPLQQILAMNPHFDFETQAFLISFLIDRAPAMLTVTTIKKLLKWLMPPETCDENGRTVLHNACVILDSLNNSAVAVVRSLLRYGFDPNAADTEGNTPIHILAKWGKKNVAFDPIARYF